MEGLDAQFSLYCRNETPPGWDAGRLTSVAQAYEVEWLASGRALTSAAWILRDIRARDNGAEFGAAHTEGVSSAGTRVGQVVPPSISMVARMYGKGGAPPKVGWVNLPYGVEADVDGERWAVPFLNSVQAHIVALRNAGPAAVAFTAAVIVSRHAGMGAPVVPIKVAVKRAAGVSNTIATTNLKEVIGAQRNRRF